MTGIGWANPLTRFRIPSWADPRRMIRRNRIRYVSIFGDNREVFLIVRLTTGNSPLADKRLAWCEHHHVIVGWPGVECIRTACHGFDRDGRVALRPTGEDLSPAHCLVAPQFGVTVAKHRVLLAAPVGVARKIAHSRVQAHRAENAPFAEVVSRALNGRKPEREQALVVYLQIVRGRHGECDLIDR